MTNRLGRAPIIGAIGLGLAISIGAMVAGCSGDAGADPGTTTGYGTAVALGHGTAKTYLTSTNGEPTELGIALSAEALDSLPSVPLMGGYEYALPLPAGNTTQYKVVGLNWNPTGHPPPMVYTVPHFDFHFYTIAASDRSRIDPALPSYYAEAATYPGVSFRPPGYVADPPANAVAQMGVHWTDTTGAEFHGQPFTRTFVAGSWNGHFIFDEPMVTRAYLLTRPNEVIATASVVAREGSGYYPGAYRVSWDSAHNEWHVALARLTKF
ncbi:MAG TPA: DUF5602 domain-containing protein [Gemmatimonadales bacterium]|jgi:hypothetical protein